MKIKRIFNSTPLYCSNCELPLKQVIYNFYGKLRRQSTCECCNQFIEGDETFAQLTERVIKKNSFGTYLPPDQLDCFNCCGAWFFPLEVPFDRKFCSVRLTPFWGEG
jgi:hypothetical protein